MKQITSRIGFGIAYLQLSIAIAFAHRTGGYEFKYPSDITEDRVWILGANLMSIRAGLDEYFYSDKKTGKVSVRKNVIRYDDKENRYEIGITAKGFVVMVFQSPTEAGLKDLVAKTLCVDKHRVGVRVCSH